MHVLMPGFFIDMKRDRARLVREPEPRLDAVRGVLPLCPVQGLAFGITHLDVKERLKASRPVGHDMDAAKRFLDVVEGEAAELPKLGAFAFLARDHVMGKFAAAVMRGPLRDHGRSLRPTISKMRAMAARVSLRASTLSRAPAACPAFKVRAIWFRLLPTLLSSAVARASAAMSTGGRRFARGPGVPSAQARRKLARLRPTALALSSTAARSSGRKRTGTAGPRCRVSLPLRLRSGRPLSFAVMGHTPYAAHATMRQRAEGMETGTVSVAAHSGTQEGMQRGGSPLPLPSWSEGRRREPPDLSGARGLPRTTC